jgi:hypothetical protein
MELEADIQPVAIAGDAVLIQVLIQNLVRNVMQHCAQHTRIHISMTSESGQPVLAISDNGPGMAPDQLERLNAGSFTRMDSKHEGLGLGLAICHRIAQVHGARLVFAANPGGAPRPPGVRARAVVRCASPRRPGRWHPSTRDARTPRASLAPRRRRPDRAIRSRPPAGAARLPVVSPCPLLL